MSRYLSEKKKQEVLKLYFNGNDRRLRIISNIVGCTEMSVSTIVGNKFTNHIEFEDDGFMIFHSELNENN